MWEAWWLTCLVDGEKSRQAENLERGKKGASLTGWQANKLLYTSTK